MLSSPRSCAYPNHCASAIGAPGTIDQAPLTKISEAMQNIHDDLSAERTYEILLLVIA